MSSITCLASSCESVLCANNLFSMFFISLASKPVLQYFFAVRCQHAFGVKLHTLHIVVTMLQPHDHSIFVLCSYLEIRWKIFFTDDPAVIASDGKRGRQSCKQLVVAFRITFC